MHYAMRVIVKPVACIAIITAGITLAAPAASAATGTVIASSGLYIQDGPSLNAKTIGSLGYQATVDFDCYLNGDAVAGPYGTETIWDHLSSGGFVSDAWVFTNNNGAVVPLCSNGATPAPPPASDHTFINGQDVGYAQNAPHEWGSGCTVQDFNGGPLGWVIVGYSFGTHVVRNGMLWGWFDNHGGPIMGCPKTDEYPFASGVRQDFELSYSLYWSPGMDHARNITPCLLNLRWDHPNLTFTYGGERRYAENAIAAANSWSNARVGLNISQATRWDNADIELIDFNDPSNGDAGIAILPNELQLPHLGIPNAPRSPSYVSIRINQAQLDKMDEAHRTAVFIHELGHILGAAHPDICWVTDPSIMKSGDNSFFTQSVVDVQWYDIINLRQLYGIPID